MQSHGPIGLRLHSALDVALVLAGLAGPWLLGYADEPVALGYTLLAVVMGMGLNLATDYPVGIFKVLPLEWHRRIEMTSAGPFILVPWLFLRSHPEMCWLLSGIGVAVTLNALLTRPLRQTAPQPAGQSPSAG